MNNIEFLKEIMKLTKKYIDQGFTDAKIDLPSYFDVNKGGYSISLHIKKINVLEDLNDENTWSD